MDSALPQIAPVESSPADEVQFRSMQAQLQAVGMTIERTQIDGGQPGYLVTVQGQVRSLPTLHDASRYVQRLGFTLMEAGTWGP